MGTRDNIDAFWRCPPANNSMPMWSPYLRLAHDFRNTIPCWHHRKDRIGDHALHYFYSGTGEYIIDGKSYPIEPRTVFLRRPGDYSEFKMNKISGRMLNLHFDLIEIDKSHCSYPCPDDDDVFKEKLPADLPEYQKLNNYQSYEQTFFELMSVAWLQGNAAALRRRGLMLKIISLLYANLENEQSTVKSLDHRRAVDKAIKHIKTHPENLYSLEELAQVAGVSRSLFCSIFVDNVGMTPHKYLNNCRVELAMAELVYSDLPIKEIARRCGFANVHHFTRIFKQISGRTPGRIRAKHKMDE